MKKGIFNYLILIPFLLFLCHSAFAFALNSDNFYNSQPIPPIYTCNGLGISPELNWDHAPPGTKSFVLTLEDPDAKDGDFTHWIIYDIPRKMHELKTDTHNLPHDVKLGTNSAGETSYFPPCPPGGMHHYEFTLYAVSIVPKLPMGASKDMVIKAIRGHIISATSLMGTVQFSKHAAKHWWKQGTV